MQLHSVSGHTASNVEVTSGTGQLRGRKQENRIVGINPTVPEGTAENHEKLTSGRSESLPLESFARYEKVNKINVISGNVCNHSLQNLGPFRPVCNNLNIKIQDRQCTHNVSQTRSRNHCCRRIAISITYSQCVCSLSYPACKAHAPCYIVICGLSGCTIFFHIIS
jgi:hypothetical protein